MVEPTTPPTYYQLLKYVHLEAVIKEKLRFYQPVTTVTRVATDPMDTYEGFRVGGGIMALSMFSLIATSSYRTIQKFFVRNVSLMAAKAILQPNFFI